MNNKDYILRVEDQGSGAKCVAYALTTVIEYQARRQHGLMMNLSPDYIYDRRINKSGSGMYKSDAINIASNGVATEYHHYRRPIGLKTYVSIGSYVNPSNMGEVRKLLRDGFIALLGGSGHSKVLVEASVLVDDDEEGFLVLDTAGSKKWKYISGLGIDLGQCYFVTDVKYDKQNDWAHEGQWLKILYYDWYMRFVRNPNLGKAIVIGSVFLLALAVRFLLGL